MSNHDGSGMLNDVIALLRREGAFERLGKAHSRRIVSEMITRASWEHDCNHSEILDGHGAGLGRRSRVASGGWRPLGLDLDPGWRT